MQAINRHLHLGNEYAEHVTNHRSTQSLDFGRLETRFLGIDAGVTGADNESAHSPEHRLRNCTDIGIKESQAGTYVACKLSTVSLFECPEYVALSYSWGNHYMTRPIMLDDFPRSVTASLEAALWELRRRRVRTIWVDSLCIDQNNNYEKVYQLSQMGKIFSKASKVVVWLGPAADDSDNAMNALSAADNGDEVVRHSVAIAKLLERPYWQRVWIIQEIAKASVVEVWCGPQTLTWDVFFAGVQQWWQTQGHHVSGLHHPIFTLKHFCDAEKQSRKRAARMLLSAAMVRTLYAKATLRRDKAYALLGIVRDGTETVPTPNYVQDDMHVFNAILKHIIVEQGQLNLALFAGSRKISRSLPSWLPDWTDERSLQASPWLLKCFENSDETTGDGEIQCREDVLKLSGQIFGPLLTEANFEVETSSPTEAQRFLLRVAWHIFLCGGSIDAGRFIDNHLSYALAALWSPTVPVAEFPKLQEWYEHHVTMGFAGETLRSSVTRVNELDSADAYRSWLQASSGPSPGGSWLMKALVCLEVSVGKMSHHQMKLCGMERHGQVHLVVVHEAITGICHVARLQNCSLPVVVFAQSEGGYCLMGEVVEEVEWYRPLPTGHFSRTDFLQGFSILRPIDEDVRKEDRDDCRDTDHDGNILGPSATNGDGHEKRCWYGVDKEPWTDVELI